MSLLQFALKSITPTADQENALASLDKFFVSNKKCFLLKGYAGTGKTTITKTIAEYLQHIKINPVLMAPTGRAARILQEKTNMNATTIHRGIYNLTELDEIMLQKNGKEQYKFRYNLNRVISNIQNVYLVDEASMISDRISETDFFIFGSGRLLYDLMAYVAPQNSERKDKIIFIGDPAQLPPVGDPVSGALSNVYLQDNYELEVAEYELTEVVRQQKDSGILHNATSLRNRLLAGNKARLDFKTNFPDIKTLKPEDVAKQYVALNSGLEYNKAVVINYSNKSALDVNLSIREKLFNNKFQVQAGDILMINQNNYNYDVELLNGMMVKVLEVSLVPEVKSNMKSYDAKGESCQVSIKFRNVKIEVPVAGGPQIITCLVMDDFLYSPEPALGYSDQIALYLDFKIRHPHLKPKTAAFRDTLRADRFFNALRVKYGYAVTCHKAQGGEWETAIVNMDTNLGKYSIGFTRWLYTAITRAGKSLYLFNYVKESIFSTIIYTQALPPSSAASVTALKMIEYQVPKEMQSIFEKFGLANESSFKKQKLTEILAMANYLHCNIVSRVAHNYQEQYSFEKDGKIATIVFWYNGQQKFGKLTIFNSPLANPAFAAELSAAFTAPVSILLIESETSKKEGVSFEAHDEQLEVLFPAGTKKVQVNLHEELNAILQPMEIEITAVEHARYQELYRFKRLNQKAAIQFYYNDMEQFTSAFNQPAHCNSNELLTDLSTAIQLLKEL